MAQKEYEMDDDYKKAAAFLVEQIAERDEIAAKLKLLSPKDRPEGLRLLAELDKAIERGEQALANEYESKQNYQRALDEQAQVAEKALHAVAGSLIHVKYRLPDKFEEAFNIFTKGFTNKEIEDFEDRMAEMEAGDLVRIIRRKGETREQAEEFLKNFRIQEEKERRAAFEEFVEKYSGKYVHTKYRQPEMREKIDEVLAEIKPDWAKEFLDVVAYLEAHHLLECIAVEGETQEETEAFLENYRAAMFDDLAERMKMIFIHIKYRHPDKLEEIRAALLNNYTPEEEKDFYDGVAILEAGDLISLIQRKGETVEETEEYLKKFRAAEARGEMLITNYE